MLTTACIAYKVVTTCYSNSTDSPGHIDAKHGFNHIRQVAPIMYPHLIVTVPSTHWCLHPIWQLDWFSRFCTAHSCVQHMPHNISNNSPHLAIVLAMWAKRGVSMTISHNAVRKCCIAEINLQFLPRDALLSVVYAVVVCLSVCHTPVLYQNG